MKRIALVVVAVVLVAGAAAAPLLIGREAQANYALWVEQLGASGLQVSSQRYERGWLRASARTEITVPVPRPTPEGGQESREARLTLVSDIRHGPLAGGIGLAQIDTRFLLDGEPLLAPDYAAALRTHVELDGSSVSRLDFPARTIALADHGVSVDFHGLEGTVQAGPGFDSVHLELASAGLGVDGGEGKRLELGSMSLRSNTARGVAGLMLGDGRFQLSRFQIRDPEAGVTFDLSEFALDGRSAADGERVAVDASYTLASASAAGRSYGPAEMQIRIEGLPAAGLAELQRRMRLIQGQHLAPDLRAIEALGAIQALLPQLLANDPRLAVPRLSVRTPDGLVEGELAIQGRGLTVAELGSPGAIARKLEASARLAMPEVLLRATLSRQRQARILREIEQRRQAGEQVAVPADDALERMAEASAEQQIEALLAQGLLERTAQGVRTEATFREGLLKVNGTVLPLPLPPP